MNANKEALERWLVVATIAGPTSIIVSSVYNDVVYHSIVDLGKAHVDKINSVINVTPLEGTLVWQQLRTMPSFEEYITVDALDMSFRYQFKIYQRDSLRSSPCIAISTLLSDEINWALYNFLQSIICNKASLTLPKGHRTHNESLTRHGVHRNM